MRDTDVGDRKAPIRKKLKAAPPARTNNEVRALLLQYFYDRNDTATSARGKKGSAVRISVAKAELKTAHGLTRQEIQRNLTYLLSQGWVEEDTVEKSFTAPSGTVIPSTTRFYKITAAGMDKIDGPGEFTMKRFHDIKIEATGQNIITLGDGNQINERFSDLGKALAELREAITESDAKESDKMDLVADIETVQSQLAKPKPSSRVVAAAWEGIRGAAAINGVAGLVDRVASLIGPFLG